VQVKQLKTITSTVQKKKNKRISLIVQSGTLKSFFPNSKINRNKELSLKWRGILKPTPLSQEYLIELIYRRNKGVDIFVKEPKPLLLYKDEKTLPHVYSTEKQKLCLYFPNFKEWDVSQLYVDSLIPWTSEWLMHYEIWLSTGKWLGGGKHPEKEEKDKPNVKE